MPYETSQQGSKTNGYIIRDSEAELARLIQQSEIFTRFEGGVLPEREDIGNLTKILDVACGPGGWSIEVAEQNPDIHVIGIDINKRMINYARNYAKRMKVENNVLFLEMDITKPLDFPSKNFDLVNARFLQSVLTTSIWPGFVQECVRVTRAGGTVRFTETVLTESTSPDYQRLVSLLPLALYKTDRSFVAEDGGYGIVLMIGQLLYGAGCSTVHYKPFAIDYSSGTDAYESMRQHLGVTYSPKFLGDFLVKAGVVTQDEYLEIYHKAMNALGTSHFRGMGHLMTIIGEKPE